MKTIQLTDEQAAELTKLLKQVRDSCNEGILGERLKHGMLTEEDQVAIDNDATVWEVEEDGLEAMASDCEAIAQILNVDID